MSAVLEVVAAVLRRPDGAVLISRRPARAHQGNRWEFPGGKIEAGEHRFLALRRELDEELGIHIDSAAPLLRIEHHYPERSVRLHVLEVFTWQGEPYGREGQPLRWIAAGQAADYEFPAANEPIKTALLLPPVAWRLPPTYTDDEAGVRLAPWLEQIGEGLVLPPLNADPVGGWPQTQALCRHSRAALAARHAGARCVTTTAVADAAAHGAPWISVNLHVDGRPDWRRVRRITRAAQLPVYVEIDDWCIPLAQARRSGAVGVIVPAADKNTAATVMLRVRSELSRAAYRC